MNKTVDTTPATLEMDASSPANLTPVAQSPNLRGVQLVRSIYADCPQREDLCIEIRPQKHEMTKEDAAAFHALRLFWAPWLGLALKMDGEVIDDVTDADVAEHIDDILEAGFHPFYSLHLRDLKKVSAKIELRKKLRKAAANTGEKVKNITISGNDETPYRWVLFCDIDCGDGQETSTIKRAPSLEVAKAAIDKALADGLPQPSLYTCSGGGYHLYWFLQEPWGCDDATYKRVVGRAYAAIGYWDMSVTDAARPSRVPATYHPKRKVFGEVISYNPELRYAPSVFDAFDDKPASHKDRQTRHAALSTEVKELKAELKEELLLKALDATELDFNEQATAYGNIYILPQGCPVCSSDAASIVHVTASGRYKCKRASCLASEASSTKGLIFEAWVPRLIEPSKAGELLTAWRMGHAYMDLDDHARVAEEFAAENPDIVYVQEFKDFLLFDGLKLARIRKHRDARGGITFAGLLRAWLRDKEARELEIESRVSKLETLWSAEFEYVLGAPPRAEDEAACLAYEAACSSYVYSLANRRVGVGAKRYAWRMPSEDFQILRAFASAAAGKEDRTAEYIAVCTDEELRNTHNGAELDATEIIKLRTLRKWSKKLNIEDSLPALKDIPFEFSRVPRYRKYLQGDHKLLTESVAALKVYSAQELDQQAHLVNVRNGTVELSNDGTWTLREARVSDLLTKSIDIDLQHISPRTNWLRFLDEVSCGDPEWIRYVQCIAGQALYGANLSQQIFFFHGSGQNGKGVLTEVLLHVLGEYGGGSNADRITQQRQKNRFEDAELWGKRLFVFSDAGNGARFDEGRLKYWTGSDTIQIERKNKEPFEAKIIATPIVNSSGQIKINAASSDFGIRRRLVIVPFDYRVPDAKRDPHLVSKLKEEAPAVLRWALEGWKAFCENGQRMPACTRIRAATGEYFEDNDWRQDFLDDCCEFIGMGFDVQSSADISVTRDELFSAYQRWALKSGIKHPMTLEKFTRDLITEERIKERLDSVPREDRGLYRTRRNGQKVRVFLGLVLNEEARGKVTKPHGFN